MLGTRALRDSLALRSTSRSSEWKDCRSGDLNVKAQSGRGRRADDVAADLVSSGLDCFGFRPAKE